MSTITDWDADMLEQRHRAEAENCTSKVIRTPPLKTYTAGDLRFMEFESPSYAIPGYLIEGLTILVGKPKLGKSWMALDWLLAIAHGGYAFGTVKVDPGDCLYMALEDSDRRLQRRINQLMDGAEEWSPRLTLCNQMERLDSGGLEQIRVWAVSMTRPTLVVIWGPQGSGGCLNAKKVSLMRYIIRAF
jgi:hypothetical protein